jgi:hypothetical protein
MFKPMIVPEKDSEQKLKALKELMAEYRVINRRYHHARKTNADAGKLLPELESKKAAVIQELTDIIGDEVKEINKAHKHKIKDFIISANAEGSLYLKITDMRFDSGIVYTDELAEEYTVALKVLGKKYFLATVEFPSRD